MVYNRISASMNKSGKPKCVTAIESDGTMREFASIKKAANYYGCSDRHIGRLIQGKSKTKDVKFMINQQAMSEKNDYAYIACAREHYFHRTTSGRSYKSDLCSKYHISAAFTPFMDRMADDTTDAEILDWKKEMQEQERQRKQANLVRMKEEMQKAEPIVAQESKPAKEDCELLTLLRSIDENLKVLVNALK